MNCGAHIVKYILFLFNFLCLVAGILLIVFGSLVLTNNDGIMKLPVDFVEFPQGIPIAAIVLGCVIFLISFLGCCGACKENNCMTVLYSICMLCLLILQIAFIVVVWVKQDDIINGINTSMAKAWEEAVKNPNDNYMNVYQSAFQCCGVKSVQDYPDAQMPIPQTCCAGSPATCEADQAYKIGCESAFDSWWRLNINLVKYVGIGIGVIELIAVIFSCCLAGAIRDSRRAQY
ncbi:CD63 family protein [Megaselia abdita]